MTFCHVLNMLDEALVFFGLTIIYILRSLAKLIHYLNVPINMLFFFQIKSPQLRRLLRKPMRRCSSKCNVSSTSTVSTPLPLLLNPTLTAFVQGYILEMGKNRHLLGSVLFRFYDYHGSVRVRVLLGNVTFM